MNNSEKAVISDRFITRTGILSLARVVQVLVTFLVFWVYAISLSKEQYGVYQKVFVIMGLLSSLLTLGLPLLIASLPHKEVVSLSWMVFFENRKYYLLIFLIVLFFTITALPFIPLATRFLLLALSILNACYIIVEILLIKMGKDKFVLYSNLTYSVIFFLAHWLILLHSPFSLNGLVFGLFLLTLCRVVIPAFRYPILLSSKKETPAGRTYTQQWIFLSLNETLENFSKHIDKIFLVWLLSATAFAIYFNGAYELPLLSILVSVSGTFINVQAREFELGNSEILNLFQKSNLLLATIIFPLFFFLEFHAGDLFSIFFRGKYQDSVLIFLISCLIIPFRIANYTVILQSKFKGRLIFMGSCLGLAIKLLGCLCLYPVWGAKGVALAVVFGTLVQMGYYLYQTARILEAPIGVVLAFKPILFWLGISGLISFAAKWITGSMDLALQLGVCLLIMFALGGISFLVVRHSMKRGQEAVEPFFRK